MTLLPLAAGANRARPGDCGFGFLVGTFFHDGVAATGVTAFLIVVGSSRGVSALVGGLLTL